MKDETYIILLRGVTPSGKNKVPMAPLRAALTKAGLKDVQTYIQSGNVIAASELTQAALERLVREVIRKSFGGDIAVVARTAKQFARVLKQKPFAAAEGARLYFSLLATEPEKKLLKELLSTDFSPDQVKYVNNTLYTLYATKHSDSKFNNNFFERKLKVTATTRNLNTMLKLVALAAAQQDAPADVSVAASRRRRGSTPISRTHPKSLIMKQEVCHGKTQEVFSGV